jgi:hypothetical protein
LAANGYFPHWPTGFIGGAMTRRKSNDDLVSSLAMPRRPARGRPTPADQVAYDADLDRWCGRIKKIADERAEDPDNFDVSSRGWCYLLEEHGLFKGDFDTAQALINDCRKSGRLPLDICCEDERRSADNMEYIDRTTPTEEAEAIIARMNEAEDNYFPHSFWEAHDVYIQMMTEKVDTKNLFTSECEPFRIPIFNAGGWSDLHSRAAAMKRFKYWEHSGKRCILLYLGDLDPGGLRTPMRSVATSPTWPAVSAGHRTS